MSQSCVVACGGTRLRRPLPAWMEVADERCKSLAEKGWARRAVVVRGVGPCGGADLEQLPGAWARRVRRGGKREYNLKRFCVENILPQLTTVRGSLRRGHGRPGKICNSLLQMPWRRSWPRARPRV